MDRVLETNHRTRYALLLIALAPVIPQLLGSIFNIWYNTVVIQPLLGSGALRDRFFQTVFVYNLAAYPVGVGLWLWKVFSLGAVFNQRRHDLPVAEERLANARRHLIH